MKITENTLCYFRFIENCGGTLVSLRVACCRFINDDCVKAIARNCPKLQGKPSLTLIILINNINYCNSHKSSCLSQS